MLGFKYVRILNIRKIRKYDRVLNVCRDIIMEGFGIFQDSEYVRFLHMQALYMVLNMPKYG